MACGGKSLWESEKQNAKLSNKIENMYGSSFLPCKIERRSNFYETKKRSGERGVFATFFVKIDTFFIYWWINFRFITKSVKNPRPLICNTEKFTHNTNASEDLVFFSAEKIKKYSMLASDNSFPVKTSNWLSCLLINAKSL